MTFKVPCNSCYSTLLYSTPLHFLLFLLFSLLLLFFLLVLLLLPHLFFLPGIEAAVLSETRRLAKKCNWTVHQVEKWFRRRHHVETLIVKSWFYDLWQVWLNYPNHPMLPSQYWYYMLQMSFYWSLLFTLGTDTKRKDFMAHVVHHFAALGLMFCSYSANYLRLGTLVMIVHDSADIWLEAAKLFNYAHWDNTCSVLFVIFAVVFFITRLILFPCWILRASIYYPVFYTQTLVIAYFVYNGQLLILQGLHLYWAYLVFKILKKFIFVKVRMDFRILLMEADYGYVLLEIGEF
uniref:Ceramide synthase 3 n=1 Tax=Pseudonaja textilis TaxID=8673 RepID=A0A670YEA4_PSETE